MERFFTKVNHNGWRSVSRAMIDRDYLSRQAATLLKLARLVKDPKLAAGLTTKAADLQDRCDQGALASNAPPISTDAQSQA